MPQREERLGGRAGTTLGGVHLVQGAGRGEQGGGSREVGGGTCRNPTHLGTRASEDCEYPIPTTGAASTNSPDKQTNVREEDDKCNCCTVDDPILPSFEEMATFAALSCLGRSSLGAQCIWPSCSGGDTWLASSCQKTCERRTKLTVKVILKNRRRRSRIDPLTIVAGQPIEMWLCIDASAGC